VPAAGRLLAIQHGAEPASGRHYQAPIFRVLRDALAAYVASGGLLNVPAPLPTEGGS